jgi:ATP-binding cassette subfamily C protein CydC
MWFFLGAFAVRFALAFLGWYLLAGVGVPLLTYLLSHHLGKQVVIVRAELQVQCSESMQGMADLLAYGQEQRQMSRVGDLNRQLMRLQARLAQVSGLQNALGSLLMNLALWTMLLLAIPLVREGMFNGVYLAVLALATLASFEAVLPLAPAFQQLGESLQAARRLFEVVDARPAVIDPETASPACQRADLVVQNLSFRYAPNAPLVLDKIRFQVSPGTCLALVGPSGVGKSTIINLLLRFWDYTEGHILLGGKELRSYRQRDLHRLISVVDQETHLFNTTIRENLLLARPGASEAELVQAAELAQLHRFVQMLPQGYDTPVGEQGLCLSGGERQRIAIARAFLKNAPILLLDEPTAHLDQEAEQAIFQALGRLKQGRTTLLITHHPGGLELAETVCVLPAGNSWNVRHALTDIPQDVRELSLLPSSLAEETARSIAKPMRSRRQWVLRKRRWQR